MTKTKNEKYFNAADVQHFKQYAEASTNWEKEQLYTKYLYDFIDKQIESVMKTLNTGTSKHIMYNYEDIRQDLHIHIFTNVLPKIDLQRVQAIQNFIYISARNKLINILNSYDSRTQIKFDYNEYNLDEERLVDEEQLCSEDIITLINNKIAELKTELKVVNSVGYTYLEHLERYIHEHDYDATGFKEYCMKEMKIQNSQFMNLSHRFGFRTIAFKSRKKKQ